MHFATTFTTWAALLHASLTRRLTMYVPTAVGLTVRTAVPKPWTSDVTTPAWYCTDHWKFLWPDKPYGKTVADASMVWAGKLLLSALYRAVLSPVVDGTSACVQTSVIVAVAMDEREQPSEACTVTLYVLNEAAPVFSGVNDICELPVPLNPRA
jgi:hypothetical protein